MIPHAEKNVIPEITISVRDPDAPRVVILKKEHINEATEVFTNAFCEGEPLTKFLGVNKDEFRPFAKEVVTKAATDQLSVVALNKDGKIMGIVIAEDIINPIQPQHGHVLGPIPEFLAVLSKHFRDMQFKRNTVIHIWITAIIEDIKGVGLSTVLNNAGVMLALNNGFSFVFAEFTSPINERHMNRFPDNMKCEMHFKDFIHKGQKPFANLEGSASSYICSAAPHITVFELEKCLLSPNQTLKELALRHGTN